MNTHTSVSTSTHRAGPRRDLLLPATLLAGLAWLLLGAHALRAATHTWDGGGIGPSPTYFSDAANWSANVVPPAGSDIVIGSAFTSGRTIYVTNSHAYSKLTFSSAAYNVHLGIGFGTPALTLSSGSVDCAASNVTLRTPVSLPTLGTWRINGSLRVTGPLTGPANPGMFAALAKSGSGTLDLAGTSTQIPTIWVQAGKLRLSTPTALPATCGLLVSRSGTFTNPTVEIAPGVQAAIGGLVMHNATVRGETNAGLTIRSAFLRDGSEVDVPLHGTADVDVDADATVALRRTSTFTGTITLGSNSSLHIESNACLGHAGNDIVVDSGEATLQIEGSGTLGPTRILYVAAGRQLTLRDFDIIRTPANGGGVLSIRGGGSIDLRANNSAFTGQINRDGGDLVVDAHGALGNAYRVAVYGPHDLILATSTAAFSEPDLSLSDLGKLIPRDNSQDFGDFIINSARVTIELNPTGMVDHAVITFDDILLPTTISATPNLTITGWTGMPGQPGTDDRIYCESPLSSTELRNIKFLGVPNSGSGAIRLASGELVPALP